MKPLAIFTLLVSLFGGFGAAALDPYESLAPAERALLEPQIERWIRDQTKHNWSDLWEIQDQTPALKNELLLGRRDAPDMERNEYVQAMKNTIGSGYPEIRAFHLTEVDKEADGFQVVGCAKLQREEWKKITVQYVHVKVVNARVLFGLYEGSGEECRL
jgi:hypothetical protein